MPNQTEGSSCSGYRSNRLATIIGRISLAMVGSLCAVFVAAFISRANIAALNSVGMLFAAILYGTIGSYLAIDISRLPSRSHRPTLSDNLRWLSTDPIKPASAIGTFLAVLAAWVSVWIIVFDAAPPGIWTKIIGFWWVFGVTLQMASGASARLARRA